jgi:hypothetical protein
MKFAKWTFFIAGIYGILVLVPFYFLENKIGLDQPPAITHPEYFYGFIGVALAWQVAFFIIAKDPVKYRMLMIPCVLEKFSYAGAILFLFLTHRLNTAMLPSGVIDFTLGNLFLISYLRLKH